MVAIAGAAAAAALAIGGVHVWNRQGPITSVAVLPLENASGDPGLDYLSDGITEGVIRDLVAGARTEGDVWRIGLQVQGKDAGSRGDCLDLARQGAARRPPRAAGGRYCDHHGDDRRVRQPPALGRRYTRPSGRHPQHQ